MARTHAEKLPRRAGLSWLALLVAVALVFGVAPAALAAGIATEDAAALAVAAAGTADATADATADTAGEADATDDATADDSTVVAEAVEGELLVVYADEALALDDALEGADADEVAAGDADGDGELSLEEAGVADQELVSEATGDDGAVALLSLEEGADADEVVSLLAADPSVAYVQPNYTYELLATTDDPYATADSSATYNQYYLYASGFTDAWDYVQVEGTVTVAVLDTGCNLAHEDLQGTVDAELAFDVTTGTLLSASGVANNGDAVGHGTLVCGIVAAYAGNACGIAGASYNATVIPVKVFDESGTCTTASVVAAYSYLDGLVDAGTVDDLRIINLSFGTYSSGDSYDDRVLYAAIESMLDEHDVVTVCAGGNGDGVRASTLACYPADFDVCVSVTALDETGANATWSDYNASKDISAYGEDILSTSATGGYASSSGTSFAAPQVAAALALVLAANPSLSSAEAVAIVQETATEVTGNAHASSGSAGALDAEAAVVLALQTEASGTSSGGSSTDGTDSDDDTTVTVWRLYNPYSGEHHFTADENEYVTLASLGWTQEGVAWVSPASGAPVYRLYNPYSGDHHYTTSLTEYETLAWLGWRQEGVAFYSASASDEGAVAVWRLYNPYAAAFYHHYTLDTNERSVLVGLGWDDEGVGWYALE